MNNKYYAIYIEVFQKEKRKKITEMQNQNGLL